MIICQSYQNYFVNRCAQVALGCSRAVHQPALRGVSKPSPQLAALTPKVQSTWNQILIFIICHKYYICTVFLDFSIFRTFVRTNNMDALSSKPTIFFRQTSEREFRQLPSRASSSTRCSVLPYVAILYFDIRSGDQH